MSGNEEVKRVVDSAVDAALSKLRAELTESIASGLPAPPPAAPAAEGGGGMSLVPLRQHVFSLFEGDGQVDVLNRLIEASTAYWGRAVLYLIKGADFQPWSVKGFSGGVGDAAVKAASIAMSSDTILSSALSGAGAGADNGLLSAALGAPEGSSAAVPLAIRGKAAAVFYVDGPKGAAEDAVAALETLARSTAAAIELGMLTKKPDPPIRSTAASAEFGGAMVAAVPVPVAVVPEVVPEPAAPAPAAPAPAAPEPPAPAPAPEAAAPATDFSFSAPPVADPEPEPAAPATDFAVSSPSVAEPAPEVAAPEVAAPEVAAPEVAAAAPAPIDVKAALANSSGGPVVDKGEESKAPASKFSRWKPVRDQIADGDEEDASLASVPEGERPKHVEAKKLARLLVSEIKLYNEAKVAVGRKNSDLYERLKDDIEASRATFNDRVDAGVASQTDYFKDELVAVLAEGDAALLGMS